MAKGRLRHHDEWSGERAGRKHTDRDIAGVPVGRPIPCGMECRHSGMPTSRAAANLSSRWISCTHVIMRGVRSIPWDVAT
jgi:hypothetical protein